MRALTWQGKRDVRVETVPDPTIEEPTDAIVRITSTAICGSDLHLYEVLGAVPRRRRHPRPRADGHRRGGRPRGHPPQAGRPRRRCRSTSPAARCWMCDRAACTPSARPRRCASRARAPRCSATPSCTAPVPGGQAEYLRVPQAHFGPIKVPDGARRRALPLPLRRAADRLAGRRVRRRARAAARSPSSASARSARSAPGSPGTTASSASSGSTWCPSASPWPGRTGSRCSTSNEVDDVARRARSSSPTAAVRTP